MRRATTNARATLRSCVYVPRRAAALDTAAARRQVTDKLL